MRAVVCHGTKLAVVEVPAPRPGKGHVLLDVESCGICGSDLHARHHADQQADALAEAGYDGAMRSDQRVVMGHEFVGRVAAYGPECAGKVPIGTLVVAMPVVRAGKDVHAIGISASAPGAYAEQVVVEEAMMFPVPEGLAPEAAVLTEPMAIGYHAVQRAEVAKGDVTIVIGCGPVGLAIIGVLKAQGVRTVVASDLSDRRRQLAATFGADVVVDPRETSPYQAAGDRGFVTSIPAKVQMGIGAMRKLRASPLPWHTVWRVLDKLGKTASQRPVIFECVGVPGMLEEIITNAPLSSRVVVAGVCMTPDTIRPVLAINKEIDLRFVVGYTPLEFRDTLHMIAGGTLDPRPMVTGTVGLDGVANAFDALTDPESHAKILIDPRSAATAPEPVPAAR
ncbi:zinc-binding dehydrogenase [Blastococcus goldschmidtiae]|uniref:Zinc-binding dehydrogenase n=1 Tax=Blastococcus goldschmidtiae TaxID=3075546 RepID=A0ABU2KCU1_9ACTN|nr:zinc-binding dehydrogenase [Blastococcus sp. DSM 46792]MDT0278010.1 zinc-binding dehydrogenase [Blastococcus sp. DSM 46792]